MKNKCFVGFQTDDKRKKALEAESRLIELIGIDSSEYFSRDLLLDDGENLHVCFFKKVEPIFTEFSCNVIIFIHGYAGWGTYFYRMIKILMNTHYIITFDLPGFGFSSRYDKQIFTCQSSCIDFFINRINQLVEKLSLERFILIGHSLGGYLSGHYVDKYLSRIKKLILLSPAGIIPPRENEKEIWKNKIAAKNKLIGLFADRITKNIFDQKRSPFEYLIKPIIPIVVKKYIKNRKLGIEVSEEKEMAEIQTYFLSQTQEAEKCIGYIFRYGSRSETPVINVFKKNWNFNSNILILYGDNDQMDFNSDKLEIQKYNLKIKVDFIEESDHQLIFQQPQKTVNKIIEFLNN